MKIERISENKIKCTLNREDLASRDIVLTEFAYGSEKARAFFRELMSMAEDEVGFEVEDIPLMIEAVPVNQDCIVLFVTKVSDPEELDTRFSRFTSRSDEYDEDEDETEEFSAEIEIEGNPENIDILGAVKDAVRNAVEGLSKAVESGNFNVAEDNFVPLNQSAKKLDAKSETKTAKKVAQPQRLYNFIYRFRSLDDVCGVAHHLQGIYYGDNTLYKDMVEGTYYLVVGFHEIPAELKSRVCDYLSEYGKKVPASYALQAYYEEHYMCVIRSNALQTLGNL